MIGTFHLVYREAEPCVDFAQQALIELDWEMIGVNLAGGLESLRIRGKCCLNAVQLTEKASSDQFATKQLRIQ
jgi:hypothetical protein